MADWKTNERTRMHGSRDVDPRVEPDGDGERRQDTSDPTAIPTTLGALFQMPISAKQNGPTDSPTTPLAFVGSPGRHSLYSRSSSVKGRNLQSTNLADSPTTPTTPSPLGSPARRSFYARSQSTNGRASKINDSSANFTAPLAFGRSGRVLPYGRNKFKSWKIQKPSFRKSQAFNAKYGLQSHHMETLQSQLYNKMRTHGMDHHTVVERLERLKEGYLTSGDQCRPESPLFSSQQPRLMEDQPAQASTIALLKNKFAKLQRFKDATQGQKIPLYPPLNYHRGQSVSSGHSPASSPSGSPRIAPSGDSSYEFDERTAALLALQQEMMWNSSSLPTASETSEVASYSSEPVGSRSPNWYSTGGESPSSSSSAASRVDDATDAVAPHYNLGPLQVGRQSNLGTFQQEESFRSASRGATMRHDTGSGACTDYSLVTLFSAEKIESLAETKFVNKIIDPQKKTASSIETAMAKLSFSLIPKLSSPKRKVQGGPWDTGLSLNSPICADPSQGGSRGTEMPETWRYNSPDVQSSSNWVECSHDITMEHPEIIDTSLRL